MIRTANISIEDFQEICRACMLKQPTKELFRLTTNSIDIELFEITKVQLNNNPVLPNSICVKCQSTLKSAIRFKRQVLDAEVKLNKILLQLGDKSIEQQKLDPISNLIKVEEVLSDQSYEENQIEDTCDLLLQDSIDSCAETSRNSNEKFSESKIDKHCLDNRRTKRKAFKLPIDNNKTKSLIKSKRRKLLDSHENVDFNNEAFEKKNVKKMYCCPDCLLTFKYDCGLKVHMVKHGKLMQCELCGTTYKSLKIYEKHVKQHPEYKPFNCLFCEKKFAVVSTLKKHRKLHDCDNPFLCKVCGKSFVHGFTLKRHLRIHTGEKPYKCNICQVSYSTSSFLVIHKRTHTTEKPYQCQACPKAFISNSALKAHVKTHSGEKKFMCPICGKGVARLPDLNIHMRFHTGERPYSCDQCPKTFSTSSSLSAHKRTHTGVKKHICKVCSKAFGEAKTLKRHFRIHTGEKPYECKDCGKRYMQSGQLKIHQKTHTNFQEKMQTEITERLHRSGNLIIAKLPEATAEKDLKRARVIVKSLANTTIDMFSVARLGVQNADNTKTRALKVCLGNPNVAKTVLRNKNRPLTTTYRACKIYDNQTPTQKEYPKDKRIELENRKKAGENLLTIKLPTIVQQDEQQKN